MAFNAPGEPFTVPDPLGDAYDEAMARNRLLQAASDPLAFREADAKRAAARDFGAHYILDLIPQGEGTSSYDASYNNGAGTGAHYPAGWKKPTELTVDEAIRMAPDLRRASGGSVIGKYQFEPGTLAELKTSMHLDGSELLTPALQDRMARQLLHRSGYDDYLAGYIKPADLQRRLSTQWSSFAEGPNNLRHQFNKSRPATVAPLKTETIMPAIEAAGGEGTPALTRALEEGRLPPDWR